MEKFTFDSNQTALFGLLAETLFDRPFVPPDGIDWKLVFKEACLQGVQLTACHRLDQHGASLELCQRIRGILRGQIVLNMRLAQQHTLIHSIMTQCQIPYCILKGLSSAHYYPDRLLRCLGDVDFLVQNEDFDRAEQALLAQGFVKDDHNDVSYHTVYHMNGCKFEMHRDFADIREGSTGELLHTYRDTMIRESLLTREDGNTYMRPSEFHHGLLLLIHTQQHLFVEGIGLRHLCDWAVFLHSFEEHTFVELFEGVLNRMGLWKFAQILSLSSALAFDQPEQTWMEPTEKNKALARYLLKDILDGGNFGAKDGNRNRVYESRLYQNAQQGTVHNGMSSLNQWVRLQWPVARACPLLLPFGWVYFFIDRFIRVIRGEKKHLPIGRTIQNSRRRRSFYKELGLFRSTK